MTETLALNKNVVKSDWREVSVNSYLSMIKQNIEQLEIEVKVVNDEMMMERCIDISNLCMLLSGVLSFNLCKMRL